LMFFSHNDILKLDKFNKDKPVQERDNSRLLLAEMTSYAESALCRRKQLLHYFGESYKEENCNNCDNCMHPTEVYPGGGYVKLALEAAMQTEERFGMLHLVDVITGKRSDYVTSYKHDQIEAFAKGNEHSEEFWRSVVRQTLLNEFLEKDITNIGILKLTEKGRKYLKDPFKITLFRNHDYNNIKKEDEEVEAVINTAHAYDEALFSMLKTLRKSVAKHKGVPPYVVFQDPSLEEMATTFPCTIEDLQKINGVGHGKALKFGDEFVDLINNYVEENDIISAFDVQVKSTVNKSKNKVFIITQIDKKLDLEEIAEAKRLPMTDVLTEIENIVSSGTKLNLEYYIDQVIDGEKQDDLYDYFLNAETDGIQEALDCEDNDEYSEEEIRLMRIKFLSEYAN
jgi:ATP-dependent DNA helicase RecQ